MKKFILILLITHCSLLIAQLPTQEWVARIPGPSNDYYGPFLSVDKNGNSYFAGTHVINDTINILCVKYNSSGAQQWSTLYKYPGYGYFAPTGFTIDTLGNAYVTSFYGLNAITTKNILTIKFSNLNGAVMWTRTYTGQYNIQSEPSDIKIDRLNNIYVTGWSDSAMLCIKYTTDGDTVWVRQYHGQMPVIDASFACALDDSLNVIMTGQRRYLGGYDTLLTVKLSTDGIFKWSKTYRYDNLINRGKKVVTDQNGNIYIGGQTRVSGVIVFLTLKYDRNGVLQWSKIYDPPGGSDNNYRNIIFDNARNSLFAVGTGSVNNNTQMTTIKYNPFDGDTVWVKRDTGIYKNGSSGDIEIDIEGNIYVTGSTNNIPPGSMGDVLTMKYSPQGNTIWSIYYNGSFNGLDAGYAIELDNLNNVYIMGVSQSSTIVYDYIVIKYSQFSGIKPISNEITKTYKLSQNYPNPFNATTKIKFSIPVSPESGTPDVKLTVFDILGRKVNDLVNESLKPGSYEVQWDAANLASGMYSYSLIVDGKIRSSKKLIIDK